MAPSSPGLRVLVVDDSHDGADSLALLLGMWGHEARVAFDGRSALEAAADFHPDVVLLDLGMPGMDGFEVARRLRKPKGSGRVALVAVSGYGSENDVRLALEAGCDAHLLKPTEPDVLRNLLDELVGGRSRRPGPQLMLGAERVTARPAEPVGGSGQPSRWPSPLESLPALRVAGLALAEASSRLIARATQATNRADACCREAEELRRAARHVRRDRTTLLATPS